MIELFIPIPEYPKYTASNLGRIKGPSGKILSQRVNNNGYLEVAMKITFVHRLVLLTWVGPPLPGQECCHGQRGKRCNEATNLRWGTRQENIKDIARFGKRQCNYPRPRRHISRSDGRSWKNATEAAREVGVSATSILNACKGRTKTCKGYTWRFKERPFVIRNCYLIVAYI